MVNKNWVEAYWQDSTDGPKRKYYRITKEGEKVIQFRMKDFEKLYHALKRLEDGNYE